MVGASFHNQWGKDNCPSTGVQVVNGTWLCKDGLLLLSSTKDGDGLQPFYYKVRGNGSRGRLKNDLAIGEHSLL